MTLYVVLVSSLCTGGARRQCAPVAHRRGGGAELRLQVSPSPVSLFFLSNVYVVSERPLWRMENYQEGEKERKYASLCTRFYHDRAQRPNADVYLLSGGRYPAQLVGANEKLKTRARDETLLKLFTSYVCLNVRCNF